MDLAELKFVVDTKDLESAAKRVAELGTAVSKLNKPMQDLTKESAKTNKELSKAEEAAAKAALAQTKLEQAQTKSAQAAAKSSSVLERQNLILEYMAQGNSKGQASILATAKAAGALDDEMLQLNKTLVTQRTLIGGDPFDKSIGLMQKLQNEYKTTTEVTNLFNKNLGLTEKQMTDLAREKQRLIALYGIEGKSLNGLSAEYEQLIQKSVKINQANDARTNSMKDQVKAQNDAAKAHSYLVTEIERVNRLTESNGTITSTVNNKLIKFEQALKASGTTAADQVIALEKYKASLMSVQKAAGNRQVDYLSRALGPQITDIAVGLATGQAPLTILLQQGGQLRDQFALAGVAGSEMGKMLVQASKAMVTSVKDIGLAVGQLVVGAITGSGKAIVNFGMQITGTSALLDIFRSKIVSLVGENSKLVSSFDALGKAFPAVIGSGIFLLITTLVALVVEYSKVIAAEKELTASLALSGAALGMSSTTAIEYAKSMNDAGISTRDAMKVISEFANTGSDASIPLKEIVKSAIEMQKYVGIATKDTTKAFSDIAEKPVEGLIKLAKSTGNVSAATILQAEAFVKAGKNAEAAQLAQEALRDSNEEVVRRMKNDLDPLQTLWLDIKTGVSSASQAIYDLLKSSTVVAIFRTVWETVAVIATEVWYVIKQTGKEISGIFSQIKAVMSGDFQGAANIGKQMKADAAIAREEQDKLIASIMNRNKAEKETLTITEEQRKANRKNAKDIEDRIKKEKETKQERAIVVPISRDIAIVQKDYNEQLRLAEGFAKDERSLLKARFDAGLIDRAEFIMRDTELLARSEQKQLDVVESFRDKYKTAYEAQGKLLRDALGNTKDAENRKVLQTAIDNLNKDFAEFNSTLDDTKTKIASAFGAREQVGLLEFQKAAFESTKTFKEYAKSQEDATANRRIDAEVQTRLLNAYGAEAVKIKAVADETKRQTAEISKFTIAQQRAFEAYQSTLNDPNASGSVRAEAYRAYITAMDNANNAISISRVSIENAGTDAIVAYYQQEYKRINDGITDSIVTALFEGGKAGSRKLRNLIVAELSRPITVVVRAVVDNLFGGMINSVTGGSGMASVLKSGYDLLTTGVSASIATSFGKLASTSFGQSLGLTTQVSGPVTASGQAATQFTPMGQNISAGLGIAGNALAGYGIQKAISGGYKTGESGIVDAITVAASAYFGPIAGVIAGVFNRAFGRKLVDSGVKGTFGGTEGFQGENFTFEKGGFFRSDRERGSALNAGTQSAFSMQFKSLQVQNALMADSLGQSTDAIANFTKDIRLSFQGLTEEQIAKKIQDEFTAINESLAQLALGTTEYTRNGETAAQALTRLSTSLLTANEAIKHWGVTLYDVNLAGANVASTFIDLFGGIEGFGQAMSFFYENFFSENEKTANLTKDLTTAFANLGEELPDTREAFRALVVAAKEAGDDQQVKNLLDLQQAFAQLVPVTETVIGVVDVLTETMKGLLKERADLEIELLQVQGRTDEANAALRALAIEGFTEAEIAAYDYNQTLRDQIQSYKDAKIAAEELVKTSIKATDDAYAALQRSVDAEKNRIDKQIDALKTRESVVRESISAINSLFELLSKNVKDLYSEVSSTSSMRFSSARAFITTSLATAKKTGYLPDTEEFSNAIDTVRNQLQRNQYTSKVDSERDRLLLALELEALQKITGVQLSTEEKTLKAIENQITSLNNQKLTLDQLLISAKEQVDVLRGVDVSIISLSEAMANLATAISAETAAKAAAAVAAPSTATGTNNTSQSSSGGYTLTTTATGATLNFPGGGTHSVAGSNAAQLLTDAYGLVSGPGGTLIRTRADGGYTPPGMTLVGEDGPELVNFSRPGMVYTAAQTNSLMAGASSSEELAAIREELVMLRAETRAVVNNTSKAAKILDRSSPDGQSLQVTVVTP
jgi:hypothetical protein